jgi:hypothetical protein
MATVSARAPGEAGGRALASIRTSQRTVGTDTPRYGIGDFMYACICGARAGSAAPRSAVRTRSIGIKSAGTAGSLSASE